MNTKSLVMMDRRPQEAGALLTRRLGVARRAHRLGGAPLQPPCPTTAGGTGPPTGGGGG